MGMMRADPVWESKGGRAEGSIDRVNIETRQLATTVQVPVTPPGAAPIPVIVGTLGQASPAADANGQAAGMTYLVVVVAR